MIARLEEGNCPLAALKAQPRPDISPGTPITVQVDVESGVPFLYGAVSTATGAFPTGTQVTLTDPNGKILQADADGQVVSLVGNSLQSCVISNPMAGTWTLVANISPEDDFNVYVYLSTIPSGDDPYQTMAAALDQQADEDVIAVLGGWACWTCKIITWAVAVAIAAIVAVGAFTIGLPASAPAVAALAALLPFAISATAMTGVLLAAISAIGAAASILVLNFCSWIGACPSGLTVSIGTPQNNSTTSGTFKIAADASGAQSVYFTLGDVDLGQVTGGSPFKYFLDSTKYSNGAYTIGALAVSGEITALAAPVSVKISN